jgi:hypothetical protein
MVMRLRCLPVIFRSPYAAARWMVRVWWTKGCSRSILKRERISLRRTAFRGVAELLDHQPLNMTMRYAHLSPAFLFAEAGLRDSPAPPKTKSNKGNVRRTGSAWGESGEIPEGLAPQAGLEPTPLRLTGGKGRVSRALRPCAGRCRIARHHWENRAILDLRFLSALAPVCRSLLRSKGKKRATVCLRTSGSLSLGEGGAAIVVHRDRLFDPLRSLLLTRRPSGCAPRAPR